MDSPNEPIIETGKAKTIDQTSKIPIESHCVVIGDGHTSNEATSLLAPGLSGRPTYDSLPTSKTPQPPQNLYLKYAWRIILSTFVIGSALLFIRSVDHIDFDLRNALKKALGGGLSGAAAMGLQVLTLMPLRTVMNYQYRYGGTTTSSIKTLYADGGFPRYYSGLTAALFQGPLARFGDTAANAGILAFLSAYPNLPIYLKTAFASLAAALFRMILTPVDTIKTTLQTQGRSGLSLLRRRVAVEGWGSMWWGSWATAGATFVGHYPWFAVYNYLDAHLPQPQTLLQKLGRQAMIGFCASVVSDSISNSLRVVKTYRQVTEEEVSYLDAARIIVRSEGPRGLLGRGLKTRILANGLQGLLFSVLWRVFMDLWEGKAGK